MTVRSSFTSRLAGGAFAAFALYLLGSRRRRRANTAPRESREAPRAGRVATTAPAREIGAVEVATLPPDLSLHEIYQRVSFT